MVASLLLSLLLAASTWAMVPRIRQNNNAPIRKFMPNSVPKVGSCLFRRSFDRVCPRNTIVKTRSEDSECQESQEASDPGIVDYFPPDISRAPFYIPMPYLQIGQILNSGYFYALDVQNMGFCAGYPGYLQTMCDPKMYEMIIDFNFQVHNAEDSSRACEFLDQLIKWDGLSKVEDLDEKELRNPMGHYFAAVVKKRKEDEFLMPSPDSNPAWFFRLDFDGVFSFKDGLNPPQRLKYKKIASKKEAVDYILKHTPEQGEFCGFYSLSYQNEKCISKYVTSGKYIEF